MAILATKWQACVWKEEEKLQWSRKWKNVRDTASS